MPEKIQKYCGHGGHRLWFWLVCFNLSSGLSVGELAWRARRKPRDLSNARRFDLSHPLFRIDVRRLVRGLAAAGLTGRQGSSGGVKH